MNISFQNRVKSNEKVTNKHSRSLIYFIWNRYTNYDIIMCIYRIMIITYVHIKQLTNTTYWFLWCPSTNHYTTRNDPEAKLSRMHKLSVKLLGYNFSYTYCHLNTHISEAGEGQRDQFGNMPIQKYRPWTIIFVHVTKIGKVNTDGNRHAYRIHAHAHTHTHI